MSVARRCDTVPALAGDRPAGWEPVTLAAALAAYNLALNRVPFPAWSYVPANLSLAAVVVWAARRRWGIGPRAIGLAGGPGIGLAIGGLFATGLGLALAAAAHVDAAAPLLRDRRARGVAGTALAYETLVRIPLGTAVPEELLYRGVVLESFRMTTTERRAVLASSAAFGAWHVGPALALIEHNRIDLPPAATAALVGALVAATAVAGAGFCLLRQWGGGLLAPALAHAATGSLSLRAAARFQRP